MPRELENAPAIPAGMEWIWGVFVKLKTADQIPYAEILAYVQLTGDELSPFDIECLKAIDVAYSGAVRHD